MSVWRCRVCEGVNQGGRVCATCGTEVPRGEPLRAAVRTRLPSPAPPVPPPVPETTSRRALRDLPSPDEVRRANPEGSFADFGDMDIRPFPGGCLVSFVPRR
jgi:hypothetical protein